MQMYAVFGSDFDANAQTRGLFASIGIEKSKKFAPDERMKKILADGVALGNAASRSIVWYPRYDMNMEGVRIYPDTNSAWVMAFDGSKTYKLNNPAKPPVNNFWAVTIYDSQTRSMLQTSQAFPTVGSQTKGIKMNEDGSTDIYFGPKAPEGYESNWLERPFQERAGS
jgi:hypothetical protein